MKMKKRHRGEERHGKLEPERKIAQERKKHSKDEERRVTERGWWQRYFGNMPQKCKRRMQRAFTASTVYLAAPRLGHKPSKMRPPTWPAGTPGGPEGPPEPAEPVRVHRTVSEPRDPARIGLRQHRRTQPLVRGRLHGLAGLPNRQRPHHQRP
jgi:hypothetical protein